MSEIIARFADGHLLVQEEKFIDQYVSGGVAFRIGHIKTVEKVLSLDVKVSGYPSQAIVAPLSEVKTSGDTIIPILRRADATGLAFAASGQNLIGFASAMSTVGSLSGIILSGTGWGDQLTSGCATSGQVVLTANVIGH